MARRLSREERMAEYKEAFNLFDKNGDGMISGQELAAVMRVLGGNPNEDEIAFMIKECDLNGNGTIELGEFIFLMENKIMESDADADEEWLREAFRVFDKDNNGYISTDEFQIVMAGLGQQLANEEIIQMIAEADLNGDGQVDFEEFVKIMMNTAGY